MSGSDKSPRLLIQAIGNPSRGDDALGPMLIERLPEGPYVAEWVYQLQVEQAEQWSRFDEVIVIDAHATLNLPVTFDEIHAAPKTDVGYSTHAVSPEQVLALNETFFEHRPRVRLLALQGTCFNLGEPLSENARVALLEGEKLLLRTIAERMTR